MAQKEWVQIADLAEAQLTPMLKQYVKAKAETPGSILFFRMGDFFELFFDDAIEASELLGLALTSRDSADKAARIPMAGIPARSVDTYVAKLIKAGRTVALCDQVEDPKTAKGIVKREVVRIVTPGTVMEPELLEESANNYLAAMVCLDGDAGLALVDVTTGEFLAAEIARDGEQGILDELTRMAPAEVLVSDRTDPAFLERLRTQFGEVAFTTRPEHEFDTDHAETTLKALFDLSTLKGLDLHDAPNALGCAGAVLSYVQETQRDSMPHLRMPRRYTPSGYVVLDASTQRNLELVESLADKSRRGTLLDVLDRTQTSMGARKLRRWVLHPLLDIDAIRNRLNAVEDFFSKTELRLTLRQELTGVGDIERLLARITARTANARDVKALGRSLEQVPQILATLAPADSALLASLRDGVDTLDDVAGWIASAIDESPPLSLNEGGIIRDGYDEELDRVHELVRGGRDWIASLQQQESDRCGIPKLKIGYNKIFGYYIEVSKANADKVPEDYIRKQTLVNAERYITPALKEREEEIVGAQERMHSMEYDLFVKVRDRIAAEAKRIHETADAVATIDALLSFADVAATKHYCKPQVDDTEGMEVRDGRHPVVEDLMKRDDFVPNDLALDPAGASMLIVTGPNMAGKSTYLRQVALITLMAQIGSFVPAAEAQIGVVDRIFTRVGASDNLVRGESTFMVEMIETANILNTATRRSLLVLDEIGRGTSTFDGISIAWSVAEHIHDRIGAKTLFATHYHELTELGNRLEHAKNVNVAVREWGGKVIFLYRIAEGGADHSYGIQVAKLAGLPKEVMAARAKCSNSSSPATPPRSASRNK
ncbi:MAG: DNA mismatch repair protein MutS [Candidatus Hydrogenedentes bacterium]|nr:DNA mismatch repair protein MutS [Candidatus Hydrogenedentota bacterium]